MESYQQTLLIHNNTFQILEFLKFSGKKYENLVLVYCSPNKNIVYLLFGEFSI